ncbi:MAG TPA: hypothetical protein VF443_09135, partial [Nitrospira sp.]
QVNVPPPVFPTASDCGAGFPPPCCAVKVRLPGVTPIAGGTAAAVIVSETVMVCGVFVAPEAAIMMGVLTVPTDKPDVLTATDIVPAPVPDAGLRLSQPALSVAVQLNVPLPELEIGIVLFAGLLPPWTAENDNVVALKPMVGVGAAVTSKFTVTVCGELAAPVPTMVIKPVCVPTERPTGFTPTLTEPKSVPEADVALFNVSQALLENAVQVSVPGPVLVTVRG